MTDILLRLSRADADVLLLAICAASEHDEISADEDHRLYHAVHAALAAPAEGPERAATGETLLTEDARMALIRSQATLMSAWSEEHWCAGWMVETERRVWHATDQLANDIKAIARVTGVWVADDGPLTFVPLHQWAAMQRATGEGSGA